MNCIKRFWSTAGNILDLFSQNEWRKVGEVVEINLYPLINGKRMSVNKALCTNDGLKYKDINHWNFAIFELKSMKVCSVHKYPYLDKIDISYHNYLSTVTLRAESKSIEVIHLEELRIAELFPVLIHPDQMFFLRDCGDVAAEWVTDFLAHDKSKLRLGLYEHWNEKLDNKKYLNYIIQGQNKIVYPFSDHLKSKNRFALLNTKSFDSIKDAVSASRCKIEAHDFYPNIVITTHGPEQFPEFTWRNIKIGECIFAKIEPCNKCTFNKVDSLIKDCKFENMNFYTILKQNLNVTTGPGDLTIDLKYINDEKRLIHCGDKVYVPTS